MSGFIEYEGKQYSPLEWQEYVAQNLPQKHKAVVETTIRVIKLHQQSIERAKQGIQDSMKLLILLAAVEPAIKPLADYLQAEVDSLK